MIAIQHLSKTFGETEVLHDITMQLESQKIYGLIGQSGSGKSTLLRCINGLVPYESGSLQVDGVEVSALGEKDMRVFRKNIGMIFQQFSLLNRLSVFDNIALPMKCWGYSKSAIQSRVSELLEMVQIPDKRDAFPRELSGGQKQRVAIARALTLNPGILLCDEATSALDPSIAQVIMQLLVDINRQLGITIVVVTHQFPIVKRYCEEAFVLENGRIAAQGSCSQLFLDPPSSLQAIMSETDQLVIPKEGITLQIILPATGEHEVFISRMGAQTGVTIRLLAAETRDFARESLASIIINIDENDMPCVQQFLEQSNVIWHRKED